MDFLYLLETVRMPVLNEFMLAITYLGDELAFLLTAMIIFWCVDKRQGYYILSVGFLGTIANQFMKLWFRIPRPWVRDPEFTILEQAREGASGYSFPSGHTQSSVGTFGGVAYVTKNKTIRASCLLACVLVPFSRMYIGVHTPADVLVSLAVAVVLIFLIRPIVMAKEGKHFPWLLAFMLLLAVGFTCFVECYPFPADIDPHNMESGLKNAYTLLGALTGLLIVYIVDEKWIKFPVDGVWWVQVLKVAIGLGLVMIVKAGLKDILNAAFGELVGRSVRYFFMVIVAGILWPLSFRYFAKIGVKE